MNERPNYLDWINLVALLPLLSVMITDLINKRRIARLRQGSLPPLIPDHDKSDASVRRRRAAKRWNERIKLFASFLNTIGAASFLAIVVVPMAQLGVVNISVLQMLSGLGIAIGAQIVAQMVLSSWKTEE